MGIIGLFFPKRKKMMADADAIRTQLTDLLDRLEKAKDNGTLVIRKGNGNGHGHGLVLRRRL